MGGRGLLLFFWVRGGGHGGCLVGNACEVSSCVGAPDWGWVRYRTGTRDWQSLTWTCTMTASQAARRDGKGLHRHVRTNHSLKIVVLGKATEPAMATEKKTGRRHASEAGRRASGVARLWVHVGRLGSRQAGWGPNAVPRVPACVYWWLSVHLT